MAAEITAGHDGRAELVVRVRHENGVIAPVILDGDTAFRLLAGADALDALIGRPWRKVLAETVLGGTSTCTTS
jgi:hypothetical protein